MGDALGRRCPVSACVLRVAPLAAVFPAWLLCRGTLDPGKEDGDPPPRRSLVARCRQNGAERGARALCGSSGDASEAARGASRTSLRTGVQRRVPAGPRWHFEDTCLKVFVPQTPRGSVGLPRLPSRGAHALDRRSPSSSVQSRVPAAVAGREAPSLPAGITGRRGGPSIRGTVSFGPLGFVS